jgi:hypothetical protein
VTIIAAECGDTRPLGKAGPAELAHTRCSGKWLAPAVHRSEEISKAFILFAKGLDGAEPTIAPQRPTL